MKIKLVIILYATLTLALPNWAKSKPRSLITKCSFGGSVPLGLIFSGEPFLYIFGNRIIDGKDLKIENFEVVHEIASANDDIRDTLLPNLDEAKIHSAYFPILNGKVETFSVRWTHASIGGRTESTILNMFDYGSKDHFRSQTNGVASALAFKFGFDGAYPVCFVRGLN